MGMSSTPNGDVLYAAQIDEFQEVFYLLDMDGDGGCLSAHCIQLTTGDLSTHTYNYKHADVYINRVGCITFEELATAIRSLDRNPTDEELQTMMNEVDVDGDGTVEFGEFLDLMARKMQVWMSTTIVQAHQEWNSPGGRGIDFLSLLQDNVAEEDLQEAFKVFDRDQDGYISPNEVRVLPR